MISVACSDSALVRNGSLWQLLVCFGVGQMCFFSQVPVVQGRISPVGMVEQASSFYGSIAECYQYCCIEITYRHQGLPKPKDS